MANSKETKKKNKQKVASAANNKTSNIVNLENFGDNLSFDGIEAFNLLRTNIMFSFTDEKKCHTIGITSPIPGTGKSVIAVNLAYSIAKMGKKVLLIDGDLRLPTVAQKLGLVQSPGLSNYLVKPIDATSVIQHFTDNMDVITSGDIPPKPSELLGSIKMEKFLQDLSEVYNYIIMDSTPVTVVSDILSAASFLDGIVLVVRKDHDNVFALNDTLRQLEHTNMRILGMVFNDGKKNKQHYRNYSNYKKKYHNYKNYEKSYKLTSTADGVKKVKK